MKDKDEIIRMKNTREYRDPGKITEPPTVRSVDAVLLEDILSTIPTSTVILKLDIEGYECKVSFFLTFPSAFRMCLQALPIPILLGETEFSIPVIFLEWAIVVRCFSD